MPPTPREIVSDCLRFNRPTRLPRDLWLLPWAWLHQPRAVAELKRLFPTDFATPASVYHPGARVKGDPYAQGLYTDEWGCTFTNIQAGLIGQVHTPQIPDLDAQSSVSPPYEILPTDRAASDNINRFCDSTDLFVKAGCCPRPWERYQFLRDSENALMDVVQAGDNLRRLLQQIHQFYLKELEFWARTQVDALMFMDDWGAQNQLLIAPELWRHYFKPLYRDYCDLAHAHGKFALMHSDGHITAILEDLVEVGVDALNSQLFCMDMTEIAAIGKGRITFWGEIDRQHVLPAKDPEEGRRAVRQVARNLFDPQGGLVAQFEFGPGANRQTALAVVDEWQQVEKNAGSGSP